MSNTREANLFNSPQIHLNLIESYIKLMMRYDETLLRGSQVKSSRRREEEAAQFAIHPPRRKAGGGGRENGSGGKCSRKGEYCWRGFENEDCASGRRNRGTKECNQEDLRDAADAAISHLAMTDCVVLILCIHDVLE